MGGDYAPGNVVTGVRQALQDSAGAIEVILAGIENEIRAEFAPDSNWWSSAEKTGICSIAHASEVITMNDPPNVALKTKKDSSIAVGITLHQEGKADAFVSAGNTGAVLSASTLILGRIKGVARPTIGAVLPTAQAPCFMVDAGTNVDCRPRHLFEFGVMGSIYMSSLLGKERPSVGLLSIGEEDIKGNEASLEAFALFKESKLNFVGNIEGRDILKGNVDVAVCDGFVGNIVLKFGESVPGFLKAKLTAFAATGFLNKLRVLMARGGLRAALKTLDYQEYGGVPLLGVNGVTIIGHGGSTPKAIKNMIHRAEEMVRYRVNSRIQEAMLNYV
jgi:glycerol-3-phosphate acyltransferase PlsX